VYKLHKSDLQPLADEVADRLPSWKVHFMSHVGRTTQTKMTLSTISLHFSIAVKVSLWIRKMIDKYHQTFIWTGVDSVHGGKCLVAWSKVARSVELGGLGVKDFTIMGYTHRLCWE
jgi:hypothetical protein